MNLKINGNFLKGFLTKTGQVISKNSPIIAASLGVIGLGCAVYSAIKATPKAMKMVEEAQETKDKEAAAKAFSEHTEVPDSTLTKKEKLVIYGKCYWKTAALTAVTAACTIGAVLLANRQTKAMTLLYGTAATTLEQYKNAAKEVVGEKKERQITDKARIDSAPKDALDDDDAYICTGNGNQRFIEGITKRQFTHDFDGIRKAVNELNASLLQTGQLTLNDYYYAMGLEELTNDIGNMIGWRYDSPYGYGRLLDVEFTSMITPNDKTVAIATITTPIMYLLD